MLDHNEFQVNNLSKGFYPVFTKFFSGFSLFDSLFNSKNTLQIQFSNFLEEKNSITTGKNHTEQPTGGSEQSFFVQLSDNFGLDNVLPRDFDTYKRYFVALRANF
ncbi:hypothetical protein [Bernardetia sp.]|uniref:hypothetical protein n=1 Tax=Bernardetia sp. TaxID=1937974 RepID=UPI0025C01301|nr:hypothetical protein [Bernardetia sp.]